jgi:hypothetical protein
VVAVVALLVGGVSRIGHQSGPFHTSVNRSFAAQGAVLADESNQTAATLRHVMNVTARLDRLTLQADLDGLAAQADDQANRAATLAGGGGDLGQFAAVFAERAQAVSGVRTAYDGLLEMQPLPEAGTPAAATSVKTLTSLSSTQASERIAAAGTLLVRSDRTYKTLRHALARGAGHARLPASTWITSTAPWQIDAVTAEVNTVAAALGATHQLVLSVVQVSPPALPSPTGAPTPGTSTLSPTTTVSLNVVLSNMGSVNEPHATVTFSLAPQPTGATPPTGATLTATRKSALAASRSVSLAPVSFKVKPGSSYLLTVAIVLPVGQVDTSQTSISELLQIAPST